VAENNGPPTSRDIYLGDILSRGLLRVEERIDGLREALSEGHTDLREAMSRQTRDVHGRISAFPAAIGESVSRAVAPMVAALEATTPRPLRWWERRPWDVVIVLATLWLLLVGTGAAVVAGLVPAELLDRLWAVATDYVSAGGLDGVVGSALAAPSP